MGELVLLVEPGYRSKYPPLGLMKIAQYHSGKGDHVEFAKGLSADKRRVTWDRVYVASLFTYDWAETVRTLKYYQRCVKPPTLNNLVIGGVLATLMGEDMLAEVPCRVVRGLLDENGKLGYDDDGGIDEILPDYGILGAIEQGYPVSNAYFAHATRGCVRRCAFCAVPEIEPRFKHYCSIADQIAQIDERYGRRRDLILLDNNVLASSEFARIVDDIKDAGFAAGAMHESVSRAGVTTRAHRRVDFNQGVDIRLLTREKMALLSGIAISPLRLAFDSVADRPLYVEKVHLAAEHGVRRLSNYVLFNFNDKPADLYERLRVNVELNAELGLQLFSFPMRFINIRCKDRLATTAGNIGPFWNRKYLRAIQCILIRTKGIVSHRLDFFERAFGKNSAEFERILLMPEDYIVHRRQHEEDGSADEWWSDYQALDSADTAAFLDVLLDHRFKNPAGIVLPSAVRRMLRHYTTGRAHQECQLTLSAVA